VTVFWSFVGLALALVPLVVGIILLVIVVRGFAALRVELESLRAEGRSSNAAQQTTAVGLPEDTTTG
jgi:hypothetical protein